MGNGDGTFQDGVRYETETSPVMVVARDLDGDLIQDLAVANLNAYDVSVLHGVGDGTFVSAGSYGAEDYPFSIAVGDFDGNGTEDLAVANRLGNDVSILLNEGASAPWHTLAATLSKEYAYSIGMFDAPLYRIRDEIFAFSPAGKELTRIMYRNAAELAEIAVEDGNLRSRLFSAAILLSRMGSKFLDSGYAATDIPFDKRTCDKMTSTITALRRSASLELSKDLDYVQTVIDRSSGKRVRQLKTMYRLTQVFHR
jgi:hypothetical protein